MRKVFTLLASCGVFYLIAASNSNFTDPLLKQNIGISALLTSSEDNQCFDLLLDTWFIEFVKLQDQGYSIKNADDIASKKATVNYKRCK